MREKCGGWSSCSFQRLLNWPIVFWSWYTRIELDHNNAPHIFQQNCHTYSSSFLSFSCTPAHIPLFFHYEISTFPLFSSAAIWYHIDCKPCDTPKHINQPSFLSQSEKFKLSLLKTSTTSSLLHFMYPNDSHNFTAIYRVEVCEASLLHPRPIEKFIGIEGTGCGYLTWWTFFCPSSQVQGERAREQ